MRTHAQGRNLRNDLRLLEDPCRETAFAVVGNDERQWFRCDTLGGTFSRAAALKEIEGCVVPQNMAVAVPTKALVNHWGFADVTTKR